MTIAGWYARTLGNVCATVCATTILAMHATVSCRFVDSKSSWRLKSRLVSVWQQAAVSTGRLSVFKACSISRFGGFPACQLLGYMQSYFVRLPEVSATVIIIAGIIHRA